MDRLQEFSNIDVTQLPPQGRDKTRSAMVLMQRGEASHGGCNVDIPSSSPWQPDSSFSNEGVTQLHVNPPPQTKFTMPREVPHSAHTSSKLPSNIEVSEPSTPLPTPLIMSPPQPLDQG